LDFESEGRWSLGEPQEWYRWMSQVTAPESDMYSPEIPNVTCVQIYTYAFKYMRYKNYIIYANKIVRIVDFSEIPAVM